MHIAITKPLFAWDCLEDSPSLSTIKRFLAKRCPTAGCWTARDGHLASFRGIASRMPPLRQ